MWEVSAVHNIQFRHWNICYFYRNKNGIRYMTLLEAVIKMKVTCFNQYIWGKLIYKSFSRILKEKCYFLITVLWFPVLLETLKQVMFIVQFLSSVVVVTGFFLGKFVKRNIYPSGSIFFYILFIDGKQFLMFANCDNMHLGVGDPCWWACPLHCLGRSSSISCKLFISIFSSLHYFETNFAGSIN